ncbi:hypothetical protein BU23DRAFT_15641 [Bimuria novae-zelandiae CBS 107.79]|uniref:Uncharacterized protein n=1 Tax=Bimuria novae-zelandiae CBS 107.79 TaxID=1447943 RepID=A0A6A5VJQ8_9PLEO|nr:hypothetical protein BU23DRAFT_15641 [Bimuria novae-zelandiae CBS 107.79]
MISIRQVFHSLRTLGNRIPDWTGDVNDHSGHTHITRRRARQTPNACHSNSASSAIAVRTLFQSAYALEHTRHSTVDVRLVPHPVTQQLGLRCRCHEGPMTVSKELRLQARSITPRLALLVRRRQLRAEARFELLRHVQNLAELLVELDFVSIVVAGFEHFFREGAEPVGAHAVDERLIRVLVGLVVFRKIHAPYKSKFE